MSKTPTQKNTEKKPPKRITKAHLENVALHYLERFASSSENLRRVLLRRVERSARYHGDDPALGAELVDQLVARYQESGLLNDQLYAESRARSLHRRGTSLRAIRQNLAVKGLGGDHIDAAIDDLRQDAAPLGDPDTPVDLDLQAALAYARRRRIGPFRLPEKRAELRERDMAALGRAGFSWDIARQVVDRQDDDEM